MITLAGADPFAPCECQAAGYEYGLYRQLKDLDEFSAYRACPEHMS